MFTYIYHWLGKILEFKLKDKLKLVKRRNGDEFISSICLSVNNQTGLSGSEWLYVYSLRKLDRHVLMYFVHI